AQRPRGRARVPRRRHRGRGGEAAGAVRPGRDAAPGPARGAGAAVPARPQRPSRAADARPAQLLGPHVPGGAQGAARPLPEAPLAGGPMERTADRAHEEVDARADVGGRPPAVGHNRAMKALVLILLGFWLGALVASWVVASANFRMVDRVLAEARPEMAQRLAPLPPDAQRQV